MGRLPTRAVRVAAHPGGTLVTVTMVIATLPGLSTSGVTDTTGVTTADADGAQNMGSIKVAATEIATAALVRMELFNAASGGQTWTSGTPTSHNVTAGMGWRTDNAQKSS